MQRSRIESPQRPGKIVTSTPCSRRMVLDPAVSTWGKSVDGDPHVPAAETYRTRLWPCVRCAPFRPRWPSMSRGLVGVWGGLGPGLGFQR